jgi:hypothetical protein
MSRSSLLASWALACILASAGVAHAEAIKPRDVPELTTLQRQYLADANEKVLNAHNLAVGNLRAKYAEALKGVLDAAEGSGSLDDALAVKTEMSLLQKGENIPAKDDPKIPPRMKELRAVYRATLAQLEANRDKALQPLKEDYARTLQGLVIILTKQSRLEDGKYVQEVERSVEEEIASARATAAKASPPGLKAPLKEFLEGTKWKWNGKELMEFAKGGLVKQDGWEHRGLVTAWNTVNDREVKLTIRKGRKNNLTAVLVFDAERSSFTGTDFNGGTLNKSERFDK